MMNEFTQMAWRNSRCLSLTSLPFYPRSVVRSRSRRSPTQSTTWPLVEPSNISSAMIVSSGLSCGVTTLYSADMQSGLLVDKQLRIENPFAPEFKLPRLQAKTAY